MFLSIHVTISQIYNVTFTVHNYKIIKEQVIRKRERRKKGP